MATLNEWVAVETELVAAMAAGNHLGSYTVAGRTVNYRSLDDIRKALVYVEGKIAGLDGAQRSNFSLARMMPVSG